MRTPARIGALLVVRGQGVARAFRFAVTTLALVVTTSTAAYAETTTLTFDELPPDREYSELVVGEYRLTPDRTSTVRVRPGGAPCDVTNCVETETPSLFFRGTRHEGRLYVERLDGRPFDPVSIDMSPNLASHCYYRYFYDDGGSESFRRAACALDELTTIEFEPRPLGPPMIVAIEFLRLGAHLQLDNLVVDERRAPTPGLYTPTADGRRLYTIGSDVIWGELGEYIGCESISSASAVPADPFGDLSSYVRSGAGQAWQESRFDEAGFLTLGGASGYSDYCFGNGESTFGIDFALAGPARVRIVGELDVSPYAWQASSAVRLTRGDGTELLVESEEGDGDRGDDPMPFELDDVLPAGLYRLELEAVGELGEASYRAEMTVSDPPPIEVEIDVRPGQSRNQINPHSHGLVPVAILAREDFDVADIDVSTLVFGPAGAMPAFDLTRGAAAHRAYRDVNDDGLIDLVSHYRSHETGIERGDVEACIGAETVDGRIVQGCDVIVTLPECGRGYELTALLLPWAWLRRRSTGRAPAD